MPFNFYHFNGFSDIFRSVIPITMFQTLWYLKQNAEKIGGGYNVSERFFHN